MIPDGWTFLPHSEVEISRGGTASSEQWEGWVGYREPGRVHWLGERSWWVKTTRREEGEVR